MMCSKRGERDAPGVFEADADVDVDVDVDVAAASGLWADDID